MAFTISYNIKANDQFSAVAQRLNAVISELEGTIKRVNKNSATLSRSFSNIASASNTTASKVKKQNDEMKQLRYNAKLGAVESNMLSDKYRKNSSALSSLNRLVQKNAAVTKLATQKQREMNRALADEKRKVSASNKALRDRVQLMRGIGSGMNEFGSKVLTRVAAPLTAAGIASVKFAMDFNKGMANVGTLIPGQTEKLQNYKKEVLDMSVQYGKSANIVSAGLYQVISNVGDTADSMQILNIANKAAVAGVAETADAVNLLTGISSDYGNTSAEMVQRISDLAFKTVELGSTTFPELANQMGKTTTLASTLGVSVDELFGSFAGLTSGTVRTAQVSTRMAGVMRALLNGAGDLGKTFKKLGVQSGDQLVKKYGGLQNALFAIRREVGNNEVAFSKLFVDQEAKLAALALTGAKSKEAAREIALMGKAAGASDTAFREQSEGINAAGFRMEQTMQRIKMMSISIGDKLLPQVEKLMIAAEPWIDWLSKLDQSTITSAMNIAKWAVVIGGASKAIGASMNMIAWGKNIQQAGAFGDALGGVGGKAGKLATALGKGGALFSSFAAGWGVGSAIFDMWNNEMQSLEERVSQTAARIGMTVTKMTDKELDVELQKQTRTQQKMDSFLNIMKATFTGNLPSYIEDAQTVRQAKIDIIQEKTRRAKERSAQLREFLAGKAPHPDSAEFKKMNAEQGRKDVLEVKITTEGGTQATVNRRRKGGYANVRVGQN